MITWCLLAFSLQKHSECHIDMRHMYSTVIFFNMFCWCHFRILLLFCVMAVCSADKNDLCGYQPEKIQTHFTGTIKHIGIKLCELKCVEIGRCLTIQYNIEALICRLSSDESKRIKSQEGFIVIPRNLSKVSPGQCGSKSCVPKFRCLETRNGLAKCVKGWKEPYPGVNPRNRRTLKGQLYDACKEGDLMRVKWILSDSRVDVNGRYAEQEVTPLLLTALHGHRQVYDFLVSKGADVSLEGVDGSNVLHAAAKGGHEEMVKRILSQNTVDINSRDKRGRTPLMWAVYFGHRNVYNLLVTSGANISLVDHTLRNILFLASGAGHVQIVQEILTRDNVELNSRADGDMTAIMLSALCGRKEVYEVLIGRGAAVLLVDDHGGNILHVACWGGHVEMVKYILLQNIYAINSRDMLGNTPLMVAAYWGHRKVFDLLVVEGADVSLVNDEGRTLFYSACGGGHVNMVKYILTQNITDINSRDMRGVTPVMWAASFGRREVCNFLVKKRADVSLVTNNGGNILHCASEGGHVDVVTYILTQNIADINGRDKKGLTPVMLAAALGHREVYDFLVNEGADVSLVCYNGRTILHGASESGHVDMVKRVLSQNIADISSRDKQGLTPVMLAAAHGHREVYDFLVNEGADVSLVCYNGRNILHGASESGHVDIVKRVLSQNIFKINSRDREGMTPVMVAAYCGREDVFNLLVGKGADVSTVTDDGRNILHGASKNGHVDMVKNILSQNVVDINSRDKNGLTPVMLAAGCGHRKVYDFLVNEGADVSLVCYNGRNILHSASKSGHVDMVKNILSQNVVDINSRDKKGLTPIMIAAYWGHRKVFDLLVIEGADAFLANDDGPNILHVATKGGHVEMVKHILTHSITDINSRDRRGVTPVMWAARRGRREVYDFLVNKGADVSLVAHDGRNILHAASQSGHVEMVMRVLSQNIFKINSRDGEGRTPLMWATFWGYRDVFDLLVNKGADVSLVNHKGNGILHVACIKGDTRMVKHILQRDIVDIQMRNGLGDTSAMVARKNGNMAMYSLLQSHIRTSLLA